MPGRADELRMVCQGTDRQSFTVTCRQGPHEAILKQGQQPVAPEIKGHVDRIILQPHALQIVFNRRLLGLPVIHADQVAFKT